ncbi:MAG: sialate O-acetylesterase [Planctomycetota bacterium]
MSRTRHHVTLCLLVLACQAEAATINLLILAGQSNMVGQAGASPRIPGSVPEDSEVAYYYDVTNTAGDFADDSGGAFGPLQAWRFNDAVRRFGPEFSLGRELVSEGFNPALLKVAVGGSDIARWQPGATDFTTLRQSIRDGVAELTASGDTVNLLGLVWLQGESDVIDPRRANAYADRLDTFLSGYRNQLNTDLPGVGFDTSPIVLVEPADWRNGLNPGIAAPPDIARVEQALMDFAAADPRASYLSTSDFVTFGDELIHFGAGDQLRLGERIAGEVIALVVPEPATVSLAVLACLAVKRRP